MCVYSVITDWKYDEWFKRYIPQPLPRPLPPIVEEPKPLPTQEEIDEFRRLLEKAREYDKKMNQPDCELEEKRQKIRKLAEELGVNVDFV